MIRYATKEDIPRIAEILVFGKRMAYRHIFRNDDYSFNQLRVLDVMQEYLDDPQRLANTLLYDDGIVKGMICMRSVTERPEAVELCDFYVEPAFQDLGIGRKLIDRFICQACSLGKKEIFLWVIKDNHSARSFYDRNGFMADAEEKPIEGTLILEKKYTRNL